MQISWKLIWFSCINFQKQLPHRRHRHALHVRVHVQRLRGAAREPRLQRSQLVQIRGRRRRQPDALRQPAVAGALRVRVHRAAVGARVQRGRRPHGQQPRADARDVTPRQVERDAARQQQQHLGHGGHHLRRQQLVGGRRRGRPPLPPAALDRRQRHFQINACWRFFTSRESELLWSRRLLGKGLRRRVLVRTAALIWPPEALLGENSGIWN